jgi:hypothetical protein
MKQLGIRVRGWHQRQLEELAVDLDLSATTVARLLLLWAVENTSDEPPENSSIEKFKQALKRGFN